MVIRFSPTEPGEWIYRITSNLARYEGQQGKFTAQESAAPGFVIPANLHHWAYTRINEIGGNVPHLWMGDTNLRFAFLDDAAFRQIVDARAAQKFNHMRGLAVGGGPDAAQAFASADEPKPAWFQHLDERIKYMNNKGLTVDLILAPARNELAQLFPGWQQRERYVRYLVARYAPMNVTWQGIEEFESYDDGRALLKELGGLLQEVRSLPASAQHGRADNFGAGAGRRLAGFRELPLGQRPDKCDRASALSRAVREFRICP